MSDCRYVMQVVIDIVVARQPEYMRTSSVLQWARNLDLCPGKIHGISFSVKS